MDINGAIAVIDASPLSPEEKRHLRRKVRTGGILPGRFAGMPNFAQILEDFPVVEGDRIAVIAFIKY